jgi:hypothetical protein
LYFGTEKLLLRVCDDFYPSGSAFVALLQHCISPASGAKTQKGTRSDETARCQLH